MEQDFCTKVLEEINKARTTPQDYSSKLRGMKTNFKGVNLVLKKGQVATKEGAAAFEEGAHFLDGMDMVGQLAFSPLLLKAAKESLRLFLLNTSNIKDVNVDDIIAKYGEPHGEYANQLDYGSDTPEMVVMNLITDDGDKSRPNRDIILNPQFKVAAVASQVDDDGSRMTAIFYATLFKELSKEEGDDNAIYQQLNPELPPGVKKIEKEEKIVEEKGKKKKVIKIVKTMDDGSVKTEISKEDL